MQPFHPFTLERWQSLHENEVDFNLSESGVHPLTTGELLALAGEKDVADIALGYGQTNGSVALRTAIAALYEGAGPENVLVTTGGAEANFVALWTLAQDGRDIAVVTPTYMQTPGIAQSLGLGVRTIALRPELGWQPDPDDIARTIDDGVGVVVITNPNNPTGAVLSDDARAAFIAAARRADAWILADEVYTGAEVAGEQTRSFFTDYGRTIATASLSKAYGLPGLRAGWAIAPETTAEALWARKDYTTIAISPLCDHLATLALRPDVRPTLLARTRQHIRAGLDTLEKWLAQQQVFEWQPPHAGAICLARYSLPVASETLAEQLRSRHSVLVVPGAQFGLEHTIRFGVGTPVSDLSQALDRFSDWIRTHTTG